ncbi:MAG TPA: M48 family metallopeptidase [Tepidisphaeraceae bacterium]
MARLQLIFPLLFWALWRGTDSSAQHWPVDPRVGTAAYFLSLVLILGLMSWTARRAMRRTSYAQVAAVPHFHRLAAYARWTVLALHGLALWGLGYGDVVLRVVPDFDHRCDSLPAFASILPVVLTWVGLIWAQYPLDRGVREQNALYAFELGEPVHAVPTRQAYLLHAVRSQILFTLAPLLSISFLRDGLAAVAPMMGWLRPAEWVITFVAAGVVFALSPELLRRVLPTEPLPPSPLRERLTSLSSRLKLGVRDILLWHTHHSMGNAAVMGVVPGVRYVLISDLLIETMTPDQLEAVFAHEAGHVKHRHIAWYIVFWLLVTLGFSVLGNRAAQWILDNQLADLVTTQAVLEVGGILIGLLLFGALSRSFERQADLFAARRLDRTGEADVPARDGTRVFASALRHVARLNNLPFDARSFTAGRPLWGRVLGRMVHHASTWLHGSIRSRIEHLAHLTDTPSAALRFDRRMIAVRVALLVGLAVSTLAFIRATQ